MSNPDEARTPYIPPPFDPREYVTKDELRTYYPTNADLAKLETTLGNKISESQRWIIGIVLLSATCATGAIGWLVSLN